MNTRRTVLLSAVLLGMGALGLVVAAQQQPTPSQQRQNARELASEGNYREAFDNLRKLILADQGTSEELVRDYELALNCLAQLQQQHEIDAFVEEVVAAHPEDWRLLATVARSLVRATISHYGFLVAGEFERGDQRGGGQFADSTERDRVWALQLMEQARPLASRDDNRTDVGSFFNDYSNTVMFNRERGDAWQLQHLTDLSELPEYDESSPYGYRFGYVGSVGKGAPVDENGDPIFYTVPEGYEAATSDGERWRWLLFMSAEVDPNRTYDAHMRLANFLRLQFSVQTLRQWGVVLPGWGGGSGTDDDVDESGTYALPTLAENETIAKLATGIKRFPLPDEFNYIRMFQELAEGNQGAYALETLATIFQDRQQYPRAAEYLRERIDRFGDTRNRTYAGQLAQITNNWGRFENVQSQAAGSGATVEYRYRNGRRVHFQAYSIDVPRLIADVKAYLQGNPGQLDWNELQIDNIGYRMVQEDETKYRGPQVAEWDVELDPRPNHFDRRITVTTPLQEAGAYLLVGQMEDGNVSRIVLWQNDTVIAKKQLDGQVMYYVADAVTGEPVERANVEFFGWRQESINQGRGPRGRRAGPRPNEYRVITSNFAEYTDTDGLIVVPPRLMNDDMQWIAIARTDAGRFAHLGFNGVWFGRRYDEQYNETKVIAITDRPVYRPDQTVQFKLWLRHAQYDDVEDARFANSPVEVEITDPQGVEVYKERSTTDELGGVAGEFALSAEPPLGNYSIRISASRVGGLGGGSFRVEEYKKPEYEVTIDAPSEPVMLGETITATITARYYFGQPVTNATVRYKVNRTERETRWYPWRPWDWLYGNGYAWFSPDYAWYPGFARWGCFAPRPTWWGYNPQPPELVLDEEVSIGPDGTVQVEIDTALAQALHGDVDHEYTITAEVIDASRRTIVGTGSVLVAREPFKVFSWTDRGWYRVGDTIQASFQSRTVDGEGVAGEGTLKLLKISYDDNGEPVEQVAQEWDLDADAEGRATQQLAASEAGQYRLSYSLDDGDGHVIEGGYLFVIRGEGFDGSEYQFNDLEIIADRAEYAPGETVQLMINTNRVGSTVLLFLRPTNGIYAGPPQVLRLDGKSTVVDVTVASADMPNFFVEAVTVAHGEVHQVVQEVIVPPEKRVLNVEVTPSAGEYRPGEEATVQVRLTDSSGEPFAGSVVMSIYDRAVEYISGGSNVPEIREHFWKWRRSHSPQTEHNLSRWFSNLLRNGETRMENLGAFGDEVADRDDGLLEQNEQNLRFSRDGGGRGGRSRLGDAAENAAMPMAAESAMGIGGGGMAGMLAPSAFAADGNLVEPTVRTQFADTAFWKADITTGADGLASVTLNMPENLTSWKVRTWAMGAGTRVGEGVADVVTFKNLLVRLQAPRFFVETDEVVLSAIVHNYLDTEKQAQVELLLEGGVLEAISTENGDPATQSSGLQRSVTIPAGGETRVDWRVKAIGEGTATVTMRALTDEESDAMQQQFPVYVHGFLKTDSYSGAIRVGQNQGVINITVPEDRRPEQSRLEVRYSPTLAGAMVDALPYLASYPYGCTEQTLNRFLPTVITQGILQRMNIHLADVRDKRTNLNAQEIGDDPARAAQWRRYDDNPVFDEAEVALMVRAGVRDLTAMQLGDGGWGWFSGWGERSYPHTTATVVHGLQLAETNGVALVPDILDRGIAWLKAHQDHEVADLQLWERTNGDKGKRRADNSDALVFMVLVDAGQIDQEMQRFLYRDRLELTLYSQAMLGLSLDTIGATEERDMILRNLSQFVTEDNANQTAYLDLPNENYWWYWYGDTIEANAYYLKLLTRVNPQDTRAAGLVKYLLNNRKHATYWNSTRDTAICIEAMADYLTASGEDQPNLLVEVWLDGERRQTVEITPETLFSFDNSFVLTGDDLTAGEHTVELRTRPLTGDGPTTNPLYYNAYVTNFTTEDFITAAGLEVTVQRKYYQLVQREDATDVVQGDRGQAIQQAAEKYDRVELENLDAVTSGDLIEIELEIQSRNDYEYVVFEDLKAAGFEPVDLQSGYTRGGLGAYVEFRDEKVAFFIRMLDRGTHSVSYRLRAETPGQFSALPTRAYAMYAPELRGNSDEIKLVIKDQP